MRAMGPGSVSSFLKTALDVVYYALYALLAIGGLLLLVGLLFSFRPDIIAQSSQFARMREAGLDMIDVIFVLGGGLLYVGGLVAIVTCLRKVFATLTAGDPFHPDNVNRLRLIGFLLAGMELGRMLFRIIFKAIAPDAADSIAGLNPTTWFAVLAVFVLAEVFREGARLRREAELTI